MDYTATIKPCIRCKRQLPESDYDIRKSNGKRKAACRECCKLFSKEAKRHARQRPKKHYDGTTYESRNIVLAELGFRNYREYLQSELWREIRARVYEQKGRLCYLCGRPATELHHNRYHLNDLKGRKTRFINPVCHQCHESIEFIRGKKRTVRQAAKSFKKLRKIQRDSEAE